MKILAISDTHNYIPRLSKIPKDIDLIIHAGDATSKGEEKQYQTFITKWKEILDIRKIPHMIYVPGNHDKNIYKYQDLFKDQPIKLLLNSSYIYNNLKIVGSSVVPPFMGFEHELGFDDRKNLWNNLIQDNIDILITHVPPFGILDLAPTPEYCGCPALRNRVIIKKPRIHIFGHIHECNGWHEEHGTLFYNVAYCDDNYSPKYEPSIIELEPIPSRCPDCNGTGMGDYQHDDNGELIFSEPCQWCGGLGQR